MRELRHVGLDVHATSISVAIADGDGVRSVCKVEHTVGRLLKVLKKLGKPGELKVVYEAGPTGLGLCRALRDAGYDCDVIAPSLVPQTPGERVKTDRRDAEKLAYLSMAGMLEAIWIPSEEDEALRDLVRARGSAKESAKRAGQQLDKFLLRQGRRPPVSMRKWTEAHLKWVRSLRFEQRAQQLACDEYLAEYDHQRERVKRLEGRLHEAAESLGAEQQAVLGALQGLRGVGFLTAMTIQSEIGDMTRFSHPTQLMKYAGVVPREYSSGERVRRGSITKTGNSHIRHVVGEAAQSLVRGRATAGATVKKRREDLNPMLVSIAEKADQRLHKRFHQLINKGKERNKAVTAVGRELLGFIWSVAVEAQLQYRRQVQEEAAA
jgi:transposase